MPGVEVDANHPPYRNRPIGVFEPKPQGCPSFAADHLEAVHFKIGDEEVFQLYLVGKPFVVVGLALVWLNIHEVQCPGRCSGKTLALHEAIMLVGPVEAQVGVFLIGFHILDFGYERARGATSVESGIDSLEHHGAKSDVFYVHLFQNMWLCELERVRSGVGIVTWKIFKIFHAF